MRAKTLLTIRIPADGSCHDFWVPNAITVAEATSYMSAILEKRCPGLFVSSQAALVHARSGHVQDPGNTVAALGYVNGEEFFLL